MNLSDFDFELPENLIALNPLKPRDSSKLLRVNSLGDFQDSVFRNITEYLSEGDLLVVNDTRVMPSLIEGFKMNVKKELTKISFTFFENLQNGQWKALAKPAKKINVNDLIFFKDKNGDLHTPIPDSFLDGITRRTVIEIAKSKNIKVHERKINPSELSNFVGCFLTGTAAEVTPVSCIAENKFKVCEMIIDLNESYQVLVKKKKAA